MIVSVVTDVVRMTGVVVVVQLPRKHLAVQNDCAIQVLDSSKMLAVEVSKKQELSIIICGIRVAICSFLL